MPWPAEYLHIIDEVGHHETWVNVIFLHLDLGPTAARSRPNQIP